MNPITVEFKNVSKSFYPPLRWRQIIKLDFKKKNPVCALNNLSLSLPKESIIGILGPNGAGKTTLLKIIATLILPDKGEVAVNGYKVGENDEKIKSLIGLAQAEERSFYWRLTGLQNLEFFAVMYGLDKIHARSRLNKLFETFQVDYHDKRFDTYSTGMKRKFALIRALIHDPDILLLDEPTKSLHLHASLELRTYIKQLVTRGKTVLFATHNMEEAENLCDVYIILHKGKIYGFGSLQDLREEIGSPTAGLSDIYLKLTGLHKNRSALDYGD